jgi:hypothetical protein
VRSFGLTMLKIGSLIIRRSDVSQQVLRIVAFSDDGRVISVPVHAVAINTPEEVIDLVTTQDDGSVDVDSGTVRPR